MTRLICIVGAGLLASAVVCAQQSGNPGGLSPDTPGLQTASPAADHSIAQDKSAWHSRCMRSWRRKSFIRERIG